MLLESAKHCVNEPNEPCKSSYTYSQALKEAYPKAIVRIQSHSFVVQRWKRSEEKIIAVRKGSNLKYERTEPIIEKWVNVSLDENTSILGTNSDSRLFIAESKAEVQENLKGYTHYSRGKKEEKHIFSSSRDKIYRRLSTHALVFSLGESWGFGRNNLTTILNLLVGRFCFECNIKMTDLEIVTERSVISIGKERYSKNVAIVYDTTGILRLTETLYDKIFELLSQVETLVNGETDLSKPLQEFCHSLRSLSKDTSSILKSSIGCKNTNLIKVFKKGTKVLFQKDDISETYKARILDHRMTQKGIGYRIEYWNGSSAPIEEVSPLIYEHQLFDYNDEQTGTSYTEYELYNDETGECQDFPE